MRIKYLILLVLLGGIANMKGGQGLIAAALLIGGALLFDRAGLWRLMEGTVDFVDAIWQRWQWVRWKWNGGR